MRFCCPPVLVGFAGTISHVHMRETGRDGKGKLGKELVVNIGLPFKEKRFFLRSRWRTHFTCLTEWYFVV